MTRHLRHLSITLLLVAWSNAAAGAATAFVQSANASGFSSATAASVTLTHDVAAGNLIAVYVAWTNTTDTLVSVTDSLGNAYRILPDATALGTWGRAAGAYARNITGGPCTITARFSAGDFAARTIIAHEISGADATDPLDGTAAHAQIDPGVGADVVTSGPVTTTANGDYIFSATTDLGHASTLDAGSGFIAREAFAYPVGALSEAFIQSSAGSIAATFSNTNSPWADFMTVMMALKPAGVLGVNRRIDWSGAGTPGGIADRQTICATLDASATSGDINDAVAACSSGVVFLNRGTYHLSGGLTFRGANNVTLRGAGPDQTILQFTDPHPCGGLRANVCVEGTSPVWSGNVPSANVANWTSGYASGTTRITVDSTAGLAVGSVVVLDQLNDVADSGGVLVSDASTFSIEGGTPGRSNRAQQQLVLVTAIDGSQLTISPGIHLPNWRASQQPQIWWWGESALNDGIEDLTLDHTNGTETSGIAFHNAYGGWVRNVTSLKAQRNHVWLNQAARIEVRDSYFYGNKNDASLSYGVESYLTSDDLAINNIFQHVTTPVMTGPSSGSVIAYNFMIDTTYFIPTWMMAGLAGSHDAGAAMNLFEGNVANQFLMDAYHGTGNLATLFRNRLTGTEPGKLQGNTIPVNIWGYNRLVNVVGNVLGTPQYHFVYEDSPAGTVGFPDRSIYVVGYTGVGESLLPGLPYDPIVRSTLLRWGNYDYATNHTHWSPAEIPADNAVPADHDLPPSLFLRSRPAWWGSMPWPAIGPDVTGGDDPAGHAHRIPAQVCYDNSPKDGSGVLVFDARCCYPIPQP